MFGECLAKTPFTYVQLAPWPDHDVEVIAGARYAQQAALALPAVGQVVAADIGDPAGAFHPIHPPFKQEVARRAALVAERLVKGNASVPLHGPVPVAVRWDAWNESWGLYHHGVPSGVCTQNGWRCGGIRVTFDQPIELRDGFARANGGASAGGFELWNEVAGDPALGGTSVGGRQLASALCTDCTKCPCSQPLELGGVLADGRTLQLNTTFISGVPTTLKYAFKDYPAMVVFDRAFGRPAAPFNATLQSAVNS